MRVFIYCFVAGSLRRFLAFSILMGCLVGAHATQLVAWGGVQTNTPIHLNNVVAVSTAVDHSLGLLADGTVVAWGEDFDSQSTVPPGLNNVLAVAAGDFFSLALRRDGKVIAWGDNELGQVDVPPSLVTVVAISAGRSHALALREDGSIVAWGSNQEGQCAYPAGLENVVFILAARDYSMAVRANGTVAAWGNGRRGETNLPGGLANVVTLAGNEGFCLALKSDGTVTGWGQDLPAIPTGLSGVVGLAAGESHCLARKADGSIVAWGSNDAGESTIPPNLAYVTSLGAGWRYSVAISGSPSLAGPLAQPQWSPNTFQVRLDSARGTVYQMQYKNSLAETLWNPMPLFTGDGSSVIILDPTANTAQRFYRITEQ